MHIKLGVHRLFSIMLPLVADTDAWSPTLNIFLHIYLWWDTCTVVCDSARAIITVPSYTAIPNAHNMLTTAATCQHFHFYSSHTCRLCVCLCVCCTMQFYIYYMRVNTHMHYTIIDARSLSVASDSAQTWCNLLSMVQVQFRIEAHATRNTDTMSSRAHMSRSIRNESPSRDYRWKRCFCVACHTHM